MSAMLVSALSPYRRGLPPKAGGIPRGGGTIRRLIRGGVIGWRGVPGTKTGGDPPLMQLPFRSRV